MLSILKIINCLVAAVQVSNVHYKCHSFYLYTSEEISEVRYLSLPHLEGYNSPTVKKISLLSYNNINNRNAFLPDFMFPYIYEITCTVIPKLTTELCLLNSNEIPVIHLDVEQSLNGEYRSMNFLKIYLPDGAEPINRNPMDFIRECKENFFDEKDIYIIEENELALGKLEMNLKCFEALHNYQKIKKRITIITLVSHDEMTFLNGIEQISPSEKEEWSNIYHKLAKFDYFTNILVLEIIISAYELNELDLITFFSSPDGRNKFDDITNFIFKLNRLVSRCNIYHDINVVKIEENDPHYNVTNSELKKAFNNVLKFEEKHHEMVDKILNIEIIIQKEEYTQISKLLGGYLQYVAVLENFVVENKLRSNLPVHKQEEPSTSFLYNLEWCKRLLQKSINNKLLEQDEIEVEDDDSEIQQSNIEIQQSNIEFIEGISLKTLTENCLSIEKKFISLVEIINKTTGMENLDEKLNEFTNELSKFKNLVIRYNYKIDSINTKNFLLREIDSKLNDKIIMESFN